MSCLPVRVSWSSKLYESCRVGWSRAAGQTARVGACQTHTGVGACWVVACCVLRVLRVSACRYRCVSGRVVLHNHSLSLSHTYIHTYIHTYAQAWPPDTCIHVYINGYINVYILTFVLHPAGCMTKVVPFVGPFGLPPGLRPNFFILDGPRGVGHRRGASATATAAVGPEL